MKKYGILLGVAILAIGVSFSYVQLTHGQAIAVNGVCGGYDDCSAGTVSGFATSQGTTYTGTWACVGSGGGTTASCSGNAAQFSTPGASYSWSCSGSSPVCLESGNGISVSTGYCAGTAPSCSSPTTSSNTSGSGTTSATTSGGITSSGTTSAGSSACITAPAPAQNTYSATFYTQMEAACQQVFGSAQDACVNSGKGTCTYSNQTLAYNCGMANSGGGVGYCLPGEAIGTNGCLAVLTPAQIEANLGGVSCPAGTNSGQAPGLGGITNPGGSTGTNTSTSGSGTTSSGTATSQTSFTTSVNSALTAISSELQSLSPSAGATTASNTTVSSGSSCSTSATVNTLSSLVTALESASGVLNSSNVSSSVLSGIQDLVTAITQALPKLASCE